MTWRVRSRAIFSELRTRGIRVRSGPVRMSYVALTSPQPQLAFGIGRHFGSAPERNRARRRLRAAFDLAWSSTSAPVTGAYLVTADRSVLAIGFDRVVASVRTCLVQVAERSAAGPPTSPSPTDQASAGADRPVSAGNGA